MAKTPSQPAVHSCCCSRAEDLCRICYITRKPFTDDDRNLVHISCFTFFICCMITCRRAACSGQYLGRRCSCRRLNCSDLCHLDPSYTLSALCVSISLANILEGSWRKSNVGLMDVDIFLWGNFTQFALLSFWQLKGMLLSNYWAVDLNQFVQYRFSPLLPAIVLLTLNNTTFRFLDQIHVFWQLTVTVEHVHVNRAFRVLCRVNNAAGKRMLFSMNEMFSFCWWDCFCWLSCILTITRLFGCREPC